jgi:hypothetical protein
MVKMETRVNKNCLNIKRDKSEKDVYKIVPKY